MGLYNDLGIQDGMTDAELATYLSTQRSIWNSKRSSADIRERMRAEQMVRYIDVLAGAEARIGDFPAPALVIKTLCVAIDHQYADYRGLEDTVLRSVGSGIYRGEFRTVLGFLNSNGAQDVSREWRTVLREMGIELPAARSMSRGSSERSEQREYLERHRREDQNARERDRDNRDESQEFRPGVSGMSGGERVEADGNGSAPGNRERAGVNGAEGEADYSGRGTGSGGVRRTNGHNPNPHRRRRKVSWQRKVKRFFRRLWRSIRRADWGSIPKMPLIIIAAVIVIIIIIAVAASRSGSSNNANSSQTATTEASTAATTDAVTQAQAEQEALISRLRGMENYTISTDSSETGPVATLTAVVPGSCNASSVLTGATGKSYGTEYLFDGDMSTSWQEGEPDEGLGVTITSTFASETDVKGIAIWGGNESSPDSYTANNRPQQITVSVSCEGQSYSKAYTLEDVDGVQTILFDSPVPMESVVIRIDSVYNGSVYNDTVITELSFLTEGTN